MSELIRNLNLIKRHRTPEWLTSSQVTAMGYLQKALAVPGTVNLYGAAGVGKTFLGWQLADSAGYAYVPDHSGLGELDLGGIIGLIVDNCPPNRSAHREIQKLLQFRNIRRAVLISRQLIDDYTSYVQLNLDEQDVHHVVSNLMRVGMARQAHGVANLWQLLNPYLPQGA